MTSQEIRKKFLDFFESRGHKIVSSSSLLPKDDPSVLLTTAGMQQFKPYYTGDKDPVKDFGSLNTVSIQKSMRTSDIDEVGDESHLTFFEMLGNFSFGGYFKEEAIKYAKEFLENLGLTIDYVTVFSGDYKTPFDEDSYKIWQSLGVTDIRKSGREDNFWGPTGSEGPCGPTTEIYIKGVEIWNLVFNEYYSKNDIFEKLEMPGVDTGMGLERLAMVLQNKKSIFETDLFESAFMRQFSGRSGRIFLDHIRGAIFLIADGVQLSNKEAGYILRRLMRRAIFHVRKLTGESESGGFSVGINEIEMTINSGVSFYGKEYPELVTNQKRILTTFEEEYGRFIKTLDAGFRELNRLHNSESKVYSTEEYVSVKDLKFRESYKILGKLSAKDAFHIFQSFGLPREVMKDYCEERGIIFDDKGFEEEFKKHQEISRAGVEKKFGGHGIGSIQDKEMAEKMTRLHTATHLLHQALHDVLGGDSPAGGEVKQMGSDITPERTRFDFTFPRKVTPFEIKKIEDTVNSKIKLNLPVTAKKMSKEKALQFGARAFFKEKYPEEVNVYSIGDPDLTKAYSKEFCDGPHVKNTGEIGIFKIIKEESSSAGIRRIRAIVE